MFRAFYTLLILVVSPLFLYSLLKKRSDKPHIGRRWIEYFGYCEPVKTSEPVIWLHTVSVGEVIGATPFVKALKLRYPHTKVVMTTTTTTGAAQAEKLGPLVEHRFMPLDFPWAIKRFIRRIQPSQLLIMETELWPNTLAITHRMQVPIAVINARLSARSCGRYQKLPAIGAFLARHIDQIFCLHHDDAERFKALGFRADQLSVTGSLKFDITVADSVIRAGKQLRYRLGAKRPVWIAASTHQGEDAIVLEAHRLLLKRCPDALLILVPRHPERFQSVAGEITEHGLSYERRTHSHKGAMLSQVYLADTMGEMMQLLAASDVCFMGGSLLGDKVGGHNLLEPAALSLPTLTGPSYFNFSDIAGQLIASQATVVCDSHERIAEALIHLLDHPEQRIECGQHAYRVVQHNRGAIDRTLTGLFPNEDA